MVHLTALLSSRRREERGALAVVVAVSTVMLFVLAALVVDLGLARDTRRQAQNSADAAALAAGTALYTLGKTPDFGAAVDAAKEYATANFGVTEADWASCTDAAMPAGWFSDATTPCISFNSLTAPTQVRVVIPNREVSTPLAAVIGTSEVQVSAYAHMSIKPNTKVRCALCILGPGPHDLQNGDVRVAGGDVHFNGSVSVGPNGLVATNGTITVEGTAGGSLSQYTPDPVTGQPKIEDPLNFMKAPDYTGFTVLPDGTNPCTGGPGVYGSFSGTCTSLPAGLYVITDKWSFSGTHSLAGTGVTLYFTCENPSGSGARPCSYPGEQGGQFDASGNGVMSITAPTTGQTKGLAVMYDRYNTSDLRLTGNGASTYTGTIYAPAATLDYRGQALGTPDSLIVVGGLAFKGGNATLDATYDESNNVDMPPTDLHLSK